MERVAFLLEDSGERLSCLLNPESLVLRRRAGVQTRQTGGGLVAGINRADDQLLYTGGGSTELTLDLLFDIQLAGSSVTTEDVRDLTRPIWDLAENTRRSDDRRRPPFCRFIWGKSWNIPGVVTAVAERLESFTAAGMPRRSWLRMRMRRVDEPPAGGRGAGGPDYLPGAQPAGARIASHEVPGAAAGERMDPLAQRGYGDASTAHSLAEHAGLDDLLRNAASTVLESSPGLAPKEGS